MISEIRKLAAVFRGIFLCAAMTVCLFFCALDGMAQETGNGAAVTVLDDANILMEEEADWLKEIAGTLSKASGWNIVVATCSDAGGKTAQTVCEEYFNRYTAGDDGISCLVDLDNRELYLATAGKAQLYLTDARLDEILEKSYAAAEQEDYTQALYLMLYESDQAHTKGIPENVKIAEEPDGMGLVKSLGSLAGSICLAGGIIWAVARRRPSGGQLPTGQTRYRRRYYRRPPAARTNVKRPANRSTVHRGAGGRKFGGRGRKF